ncbi:MAG: PKD domain-containing protein [Thermodesulfovibrionia bacterium]|nr:PKD domain-containing protein [Thermodesulfovibrionia bacterium]
MKHLKLSFVYFGILFLLIAGCVVVDGDPDITTYTNSVDTNNMYPVVDHGSSITFYATSNETITTWAWYVDTVNQSHGFDNLTYAWTSKGYKNVSVTATNANGTSPMITWNPYVQMEMAGAGDTISNMDETGYDNLMLGLEGDSPDFEVMLWGITEPFQVVVGNMFFAILFGIPMLMFYLRQGSLIIPSMFGIIMGTMLFAFFPASFAETASAIIVMSMLAVFYTFYKARR